MVKRGILLVALLVVLVPSIAYSADVPKLPGSTIKTEAALSKATAVFVGKITDLGVQDKFPPVMRVGMSYFHVKVEVLQLLRGFVNGQILVEFVAFNEKQETTPIIETPYIFFVTEGGNSSGSSIDRYSVLKLMPATNDNVLAVQKRSSK